MILCRHPMRRRRKRTSLRLCRTKETPSVGMATWRDARRIPQRARLHHVGEGSADRRAWHMDYNFAWPHGPLGRLPPGVFGTSRGPAVQRGRTLRSSQALRAPPRLTANESKGGTVSSCRWSYWEQAISSRALMQGPGDHGNCELAELRKCMLLEISRPFLINYERDWQLFPPE